jgi:MoxR-like ATPase
MILPDSPAKLASVLASTYLLREEAAVVVWLALKLGKPLLLEGPPGVGKTDLARALSERLGRELLRIQCYEGLDEARALYEWNHGKQLLASAQASNRTSGPQEIDLYTRDYLIPRPLLRALESTQGSVLLIDEVDRADPEFEAFLLEYLAESQVSIPELGTLRAQVAPITLLTTNGSREMTDALRRRCLHLFLDYPSPSDEQKILELRVPGISHVLADQLARFVAEVRKLDLRKKPSIAETIDFALALITMGKSALDRSAADAAIATLVKHRDDREGVEKALATLPA